MEIVKASVTEVTGTHVRLDDGSRLSCGMVVWSTGLAPRYVSIISVSSSIGVGHPVWIM